MCVGVCVCACAMAHMWRPENNLQDWLSFYYVGSGVWQQGPFPSEPSHWLFRSFILQLIVLHSLSPPWNNL